MIGGSSVSEKASRRVRHGTVSGRVGARPRGSGKDIPDGFDTSIPLRNTTVIPSPIGLVETRRWRVPRTAHVRYGEASARRGCSLAEGDPPGRLHGERASGEAHRPPRVNAGRASRKNESPASEPFFPPPPA